MAECLPQVWAPSLDVPTRAGQRGGKFEAYVPDPLDGRPFAIRNELARRAAEVEKGVRDLSLGPESRGVEGLARFLLRSEAIASSRIEGMQVSPQQVALAEPAEAEQLTKVGFSRTAQLVANNITIPVHRRQRPGQQGPYPHRPDPPRTHAVGGAPGQPGAPDQVRRVSGRTHRVSVCR
ncbi:hypothetical protein BJF78_28045 [Pseudonocardia sp. CNS-139]|nr:hypothetical protein BJF78_28045 [Pseudonocardia sp. CNS-139]